MFRTPLCISILLIFGAFYFVWEKQVRVRKKDQKPYEMIVAETTALRSKSALEHAPLCQFRKQVRKEIWLPQKKTEDRNKDHLDYTESDSRIGSCQGGFLNLSQVQPTLRKLNLKSLATEADLKFDGCSTKAEPVLESREVYILLEIASSDLLLSEKNRKIDAIEHWENIQGTPLVFAQKGQLDLRSASLFLEGSVCFAAPFSEKQSFALADFATLYWEEPRILLEGSPSQRVLFWQDGMEISAPAIQVRNTIEALGNVRLTLDSAEMLRKSQFLKTVRELP